MADWYCSSVKYAAVAQFAISTAYSVGNIVRQLAAPSVGSERCFRCTTAGTSAGSEPSWNLTTGATTTSNTAVFTEVTGNPTYNWSAPFARLTAAMTRAAAGDRVVLGSDNADTANAALNFSGNGTSASPTTVVTVSTSGSVPPVPADFVSTPTATCTDSGANNTNFSNYSYYSGVIFVEGNQITFTAAASDQRFDNCSFRGANASIPMDFNSTSHQNVHLNNCDARFPGTGAKIQWTGGVLTWRNSTIVTGSNMPTTLFDLTSATKAGVMTFDGVDFSMLGSGKTIFSNPSSGEVKVNCLNCKFDSAATLDGGTWARGAEINLMNCESVPSSKLRVTYQGTKYTESTIVVGTETLTWKVTTTANANAPFPFECWPITIQNTTTGSAKTVTIHTVTDNVTLTNADIYLEVEYLGTGSSSRSSLATGASFPILATVANWATSSASWTTTGLTTPVKQDITVTFTPQVSGLFRIIVKIAKASTTVYVSPLATVT